MQGSYSATYSTGCDKPVCTRATLWRQHYITTSKEYLTNSHILSIYFELAFLQLHLVKISCKLIIIWVNYERNKKGACFFETQCRMRFIYPLINLSSKTTTENRYGTNITYPDHKHNWIGHLINQYEWVFVAVVRVLSYIYCSSETLPPKNTTYSSICWFIEHKENIKRI